MPQINPQLQTFATKVHDLTAFAFQHKIDCHALIGVNNWLLPQLQGQAAATTTMPSTTTGNGAQLPAPQGEFSDAVLAAVTSSKALGGVNLPDLSAILKPWNKRNAEIGTALRALERKGLIQVRGDKWMPKTTRAANIDKSIDQRRTRRKTGTGRTVATPAAGAAETATDQPAAAAAG